jgi:Cu/Zn superoxide dismutase
VNFTIKADRAAGAGITGRRRRPTGRRRRAPLPGRPRAWAAAASPVLAVGLALALAGPAAAVTRDAADQPAAVAHRQAASDVLRLHPMPVGTVRFGRQHGRLTVHAALFGLTPGSAHGVDLRLPGGGTVRFSTLTANPVGQARATLSSHYTGRLWPGSRLVIRMGTGRHGVAAERIAVTRVAGPPHRRYRLRAVEAGSAAGPLRGHAVLRYNSSRHTLTVTVSASGLTPGPHAAHIHLGSCMRQGPVEYMLRDLVAGPGGRVVRAVRTFRHVLAPIPAHGWYLNIHQGSSATILSNGQPTIFFRPLLCANIH